MAAGISPREYQERRAELRKSLDGVMVLFGADDPDDLHTSFFQESNFLYLSGWREPGAVMLLTQQTEILFLPARDLRMELYTGRKLDPADPDAPKQTGFERVMPKSALESAFLKVLETSPRVYIITGDHVWPKTEIASGVPRRGRCGARHRAFPHGEIGGRDRADRQGHRCHRRGASCWMEENAPRSLGIRDRRRHDECIFRAWLRAERLCAHCGQWTK